MRSTLKVEAYDTEVCRIVQDVLLTMSQYPVEPGDGSLLPGAERVTCAVYFAGIWSGALLIECPLPMALEVTARLMGIPKPVQFDDDVYDALGEFANMVGGNLKSVLPPGVTLSMPSVVEGSRYSLRVCGTKRKNRMTFHGPDGPFWVTLANTEP